MSSTFQLDQNSEIQRECLSANAFNFMNYFVLYSLYLSTGINNADWSYFLFPADMDDLVGWVVAVGIAFVTFRYFFGSSSFLSSI